MSGQFTGMDIQAVRDLATLMADKATAIEELTTAITNKLNSVQWVGPDHDAFENDWNGTMVNNLKNVQTMLDDHSQRASKNADEQETASSK